MAAADTWGDVGGRTGLAAMIRRRGELLPEGLVTIVGRRTDDSKGKRPVAAGLFGEGRGRAWDRYAAVSQ